MMPLRLARLLTVGAAAPLLAAAQVPPAAPKAPRSPEPYVKPLPPLPFVDFDRLQDIERRAADMKFRMNDIALHAEDMKFRAEEMAQKALLDIPTKFDFKFDYKFDSKLDEMKLEQFGKFDGREKFLNGRPRAPFANDDPADSLYRAAREALNRGEYRRAAQLFSDVVK